MQFFCAWSMYLEVLYIGKKYHYISLQNTRFVLHWYCRCMWGLQRQSGVPATFNGFELSTDRERRNPPLHAYAGYYTSCTEGRTSLAFFAESQNTMPPLFLVASYKVYTRDVRIPKLGPMSIPKLPDTLTDTDIFTIFWKFIQIKNVFFFYLIIDSSSIV